MYNLYTCENVNNYGQSRSIFNTQAALAGVSGKVYFCKSFPCSEDIERRAEELPFHLEVIGNTERLKQCLVDKQMFDQLYKEDTKLQLMRYWRVAGGYPLAASESTKAIHKYIQVG